MPSPVWWVPFNLLRALEQNKKVQKGRICFFFWDTHLLLPSDICTPGAWTFETKLNYITALLFLQPAEDWDSSASTVT